MKLHTILYATDMARSVAFYESLGLTRTGELNPHWNEFAIGDAKLALHGDMGQPLPAPTQRVEVFLVVPADGTLDRLHAAQPDAGEIRNLGFGRHFAATDPDGQVVSVLESPGEA
jgi:predicted enzyme related to lactoylglutathione lyase